MARKAMQERQAALRAEEEALTQSIEALKLEEQVTEMDSTKEQDRDVSVSIEEVVHEILEEVEDVKNAGFLNEDEAKEKLVDDIFEELQDEGTANGSTKSDPTGLGEPLEEVEETILEDEKLERISAVQNLEDELATVEASKIQDIMQTELPDQAGKSDLTGLGEPLQEDGLNLREELKEELVTPAPEHEQVFMEPKVPETPELDRLARVRRAIRLISARQQRIAELLAVCDNILDS